MRRTQGERKTVVDYLTCLNALFDRLAPVERGKENRLRASPHVIALANNGAAHFGHRFRVSRVIS